MSEAQQQTQDIVIHKIWRKGRFASFNYWEQANKISIDIGEFSDGKLIGATKCYVDLLPFYTYLDAEHHDRLKTVYPKFDSEGFAVYGGNAKVARVFKSHWWMNGQNTDLSSRVFKCGHFEAKVSGTGAIIPDMSKPLSMTSIKISMEEIAHVYHAYSSLLALRPGILFGGEVKDGE